MVRSQGHVWHRWVDAQYTRKLFLILNLLYISVQCFPMKLMVRIQLSQLKNEGQNGKHILRGSQNHMQIAQNRAWHRVIIQSTRSNIISSFRSSSLH